MHRIDSSGATAGGLFQQGNPAAGQQSTVVTPDWLNDMQESLCRLVERAGIALTKGDYDQLWQAFEYYGVASGLKGYDTLANLQADLTPPDQCVAIVMNDPTADNNWTYRKSGASGSGSWIKAATDRVAAVETRISALESPNATPEFFNRQGYISTTGSFVSDSNWNATELIRLASIRVDTISLYGHTNAASIAFYDTNGAFINGITASTIGEIIATFPAPPAGAVFVAFTCQSLAINTTQKLAFRTIPEGLEPNSGSKGGLINAADLTTSPGFINTSGDIASTTDNNWLQTDFIPIEEGGSIVCALIGQTTVNSISFYDSSRQFLQGYQAAGDALPAAQFEETVTAPAGTAYFKMCCGNPDTYSLNLSAGYGASAYFHRNAFAALNSAALKIAEIEKPPTNEDIFPRVGYVNTTGGFVADANWRATNLLRVDSLRVGSLALCGHTSIATIAFFDGNKTFLSGSIAATNGQMITVYPAAPADAVFVAFTYNYGANPPYQTISIQAIPSTLPPEIEMGKVLVDAAKKTINQGYVDLNGIPGHTTDVNWLYSDLLEINEGDAIACNMVGHTSVNCVSFYQADGTFIEGHSALGDTYPSDVFNQTVIAPAGAAFFRLSFGNPQNYSYAITYGIATAIRQKDLDDATFKNSKAIQELDYKTETPYISRRKIDLQPTDKVILYGTSISSTDYPWYQEAMAALTGAAVYNGGFSGYNSAQLASNACLQRIFDYAPRLIVAMTGGNDTGAAGTVGTFLGAIPGEPIVAETDITQDYAGTYFIQAVSHIMRKINDYYYNIRARAGLTGTETEAQKEAMIDAVLKPILVFCTPLPQQRNNSSDAFSLPENWLRKRAAVVECSNKYKIHCVDLCSKVPFDMSLEPFWTSPTDKSTDNGIYYMDGLHPNKWGFRIISEIVCAEIGI